MCAKVEVVKDPIWKPKDAAELIIHFIVYHNVWIRRYFQPL